MAKNIEKEQTTTQDKSTDFSWIRLLLFFVFNGVLTYKYCNDTISQNIWEAIPIYFGLFIILLPLSSIAFLFIDLLIRLCCLEQRAIEELKRAIWLLGCAIGLFIILFIWLIIDRGKQFDNKEQIAKKTLYEPKTQIYLKETRPYSSYEKSKQPTALCWDGAETKSIEHKGACSHHGGVRFWY